VAAFEKMPDVLVLLFAPRGAPAADEMPIHTKRPAMTASRALLVKLMEQYASLAYRLTLLEIQKLAYFLQEAGEPLKLRYEPGHYGPFAANLNKVLERMEGHLIRGYGDSQRPDAEIGLLNGAVAEADAFLGTQPNSKERLERVRELIEGFETPYGMELLSTVHWVAKRDETATTAADAARSVARWNDRKRKMFPEVRVRVAWKQLADLGWIEPAAIPPGLSRERAGGRLG
jgi:hypothetical protein